MFAFLGEPVINNWLFCCTRDVFFVNLLDLKHIAMTKKYLFTLSIGYVGAEHREVMELEFDDNATKEEIDKELEEVWTDWVWNYVDGGWTETDEEEC